MNSPAPRTQRRPGGSGGLPAAVAAALWLAVAATPLLALPPQEEAYCFAVADSGDNLVFINKDGDGFLDLGLTGTGAMEAIAFNPGISACGTVGSPRNIGGCLYAVNGDDFGFLDYDDSWDGDGNDSEFIQVSADVGTCTLPGGATVTINDIDGMQFDVTRTDASTGTFVLWATVRDGDGSAPDDVLVQIDPRTGLVDTTPTPGFTGGATCVRMSGAQVDVDDIAAKPSDGLLYAVSNTGGGTDDLVVVDPVTGATSIVSFFANTNPPPPNITDMEGLSFGFDSVLYGTTGASGTSPNDFWRIDTPDGDTTLIAPFPSLGDYEAVACLTDNLITGTVFFDVDGDGLLEPSEGDAGFTSARVVVYIDVNGNDLVDAGDTRLCENPGAGFNLACPVTDPDGFYLFPVGQGNFVIDVDTATLPAGHTLTTDNDEEADFALTAFALTDPSNDFGFTMPAGSGDLDITKTSDAGGPVVQGQPVTYTIQVTNNTGVTHTGIEVHDALPPGVTYAAQTTVASGPGEFYVRDEFGAVSFANNDGSVNWSAAWVEVDPEAGGAGPAAGQVQVVGGTLRLDDSPDTGGQPSLARAANLTGLTTAIFSFDFSTSVGVDATDAVTVEASSAGTGGPFTTLEVFTGIVGATSGSRVFDLSPFISATTAVRFRVSANYGAGDEFFFVDNVEIRAAETFRDTFSPPFTNPGSFQRQDGTLLWATDWLEVGESDGPTAGDIRVLADPDLGGGVLRIRDNDNGGEGVQREANLSGYVTATLSFSFRRTDLDDVLDYAKVEISSNGGASWAELDRFTGPADDAAYSPRVYDISSFIAANTRVRFLSSPDLGGGDEIYFDNVTIDVRAPRPIVKDNVPGGGNTDLADGVPGNLVEAADGFILANGQSLTVTLAVTVDNPLDPYRANLLDTAVTTSDQSALPAIARHSDPVVSGAVGDRVWLDVDGDGVQDVGEPGLVNVEVTLYLDDGDGIPEPGTDDVQVGAPARTGADGRYLFDHLAPGTYFVDVTDATVPAGLALSPGSTDPSPNRTVVTDEVFLDLDFGYTGPAGTATIGDFVWSDLDRDGVQDPFEIGIGGVTLDRISAGPDGAFGTADDVVEDTVTTAADGRYLFTAVPAGTYLVRVTDTGSQLTGFSVTSGPQSEGSSTSAPVAVAAGDVVSDVDFGYAADACLPRMDFETDAAGNPLVAGQEIDNEWLAWGVTVSFTATPGAGPAMIFDSANPTGGDVDLGSPNETCTPPGPGIGTEGEVGQPGENCFPQGNLLIISEDGDSSDPDDSGFGGTITFTFTRDTRIESVDFLDAENTLDSVELFDSLDNSIFFSNLTAPGDNAFELLPVNTAGARRMVVTFPASGAISGIDFCLGSLRDKVWLDANGDGLFQLSEQGIAGVTVSLLDSAGNVVATTTTDADGDFGFDGLADGDYTIVITDTAGELNALGGTTAPAQAGQLGVSIVDGDDVVGINFGYNAPGTIGDTVWTEVGAANGVRDAGEPGIAGVEMALVSDAGGDGLFGTSDDVVAAVTTTGADGMYLFTGVAPGTWVVVADVGPDGVPASGDEELAAAGYTLVSDPDATLDGVGTATIGLAGTDLSMDFGYQNAALPDVSGNVFEDLDRDGVDDGAGEPGFGGVTMALLDAAGNVVATTVTDAAGDYLFADLPAGDYTVAVTDTAGILDGYTLTSGLDAIDVTVAAADITGIDFGYIRDPASASIGDTVWLDLDGDGIENASEPGISGVTVELWPDLDGDGLFEPGGDDGAAPLATTVTDADGRYRFAGLDAGLYFTRVVEATLPGAPGDLTRSDATGDASAQVALSEGEFYDRADFGYEAAAGTGGIGDLVWYDADGDGNQDPGEVGIGGVRVDLYDETQTMLLATVVTAPDGRYLFTGLAPARYVAIVDTTTLPASYNTTPTNTPGGRVEHFPVVTAGVIEAWVDWGFDALAGVTGSIGDRVFLDQDGDGTDDPGEPGIPGVTIDLVDSGGSVVATTTTDAAGAYDFVGVPAGSYTVRVTDIAGLLDDLNLTFGTNPTAPIALAAGQDYDDADFGYAPSDPPSAIGAIGNLVWHDLDNDGFRDAGESGIAGVPVDLWLDVNGDGAITLGVDNLLRTATTDASGEYEFLGLPAADYVVDVQDTAPALAGFVRSALGTPDTDDNGQPDPYAATLSAGQPSVFWADFGYRADPTMNVSSISGTTYFDVGGDALINGDDRGIPGVTLRLYRDVDGDGVLDPGEPLIATTTSGVPDPMDPTNEGYYEFTDLPDGDYLVVSDPIGTFLFGKRQTTQTASAGIEPATIAGADSPNHDFGYTVTATLALVSRFEAYLEGGRTAVEWETASEVGTLGFYLYRWDREAAGYVPVNAEILTAAVGSPAGGVYRYLDDGADPGAVERYALVEIEAGGRETTYGPFEVLAAGGLRRAPAAGSEEVFRPAARRPSERSRLRLEASRREAAGGARAVGDVRERLSRRERGGTAAGILPRRPDSGRVTAVKIHVRETGIHRVPVADLAAAFGVPPEITRRFLERGRFALESRGEPVAWAAADGGSSLVFFGEAIDSIYTRDNVYRLSVGRPTAMGTAAGGAPAPGPAASFEHSEHHERESFAATVVTRDPESDYWFWSFVTAGNATHGSKRFPLPVADPAAGGGRLAVALFGATDTPIELEHHAVIRVNGIEVGEARWGGAVAHRFEVELPAGTLFAGANEVEVEGRLDAGVPYSIFYVDSFDLTYRRSYRAAADRLTFRGEEQAVVSVSGFSVPEIEVYEIGDPARPRRVTGVTIDLAGDGSYRASLAPESPDAVYTAVAAGASLAPAALVGDRASFLVAESAGADYVVVAGSTLVEPSRDLALSRRRLGLRTLVVDVEDVYDEFNHGLASPHAIRDFLAHAWESWTRRPRFVVLAGGGTFDYEDHLGHGGNLVPPLMTATPFGLFAADALFADVEGDDGVPEMAIGRIPAVTVDELAAYLEKLESYEAGGGTGRVLLAADDPDAAGDFPADSEAVASLLPAGIEAPRIYLGERPLGEARGLLRDWLATGVDYLNFVGHGGIDRFAAEGLLTADDVAGLPAGGPHPVVLSLTCAAGRFELPGFFSLGAALVLEPDRGAVAVWSPSGLSFDDEAAILDRAFFAAAYGSEPMALGEAVNAALGVHAERGLFPFMARIYNVLGDPAVGLR